MLNYNKILRTFTPLFSYWGDAVYLGAASHNDQKFPCVLACNIKTLFFFYERYEFLQEKLITISEKSKENLVLAKYLRENEIDEREGLMIKIEVHRETQ